MISIDDIVDCVLQEQLINPIISQCTYQSLPRNSLVCYASLLMGVAGDPSGPIVEIGTDVGLSALSLAVGANCINDVKVYSFDVRPESLTFTKKLADKLGITNLELILGTSHDVRNYTKEIGIGYIDGEHAFQWCYTDLTNLYPLLGPYGKILLHDFPVPLRGWENKMHFNGVGHACLKFGQEHPRLSFSYLGGSFLCASNYSPFDWEIEKATSVIPK